MPNHYGCICGWQDCQKFHNCFKERNGHPWSGKLLTLKYEPDSNLWKSVCNFIKPSHEKIVELQTKFNGSKGEKADSGRQKVTTFKLARHHYSLAVLSLDGYLTAPIPIDVARQQNCYPGRVLHADKYLLFDTSGKSDAWRNNNPGILLIKAPENACINVKDEYMKLQSIDSEASRLANEASQNRSEEDAGERPRTRRKREEAKRQEYMNLQSMDSAEASRLANEFSQNRLAKEAEERHQRMREREKQQRKWEEQQRLIERERQEKEDQRQRECQEEEDQRRTPAQWRVLLASKDTELASKLAAKDTELASKSAQILSLENELSSVKKRLVQRSWHSIALSKMQEMVSRRLS